MVKDKIAGLGGALEVWGREFEMWRSGRAGGWWEGVGMVVVGRGWEAVKGEASYREEGW